MPVASGKAVGRLSLYRRLLQSLQQEQHKYIYSHILAELAGLNSAQVRRDLMQLGCTGTPAKGYNIAELLADLNQFFVGDCKQRVALVGVGNLGRAILGFFPVHRPSVSIVAAFDNNAAKTNQVVFGCRCFAMSELNERIQSLQINSAIVAVPADQGQIVAEQLVAAGVSGLLNFAPTPLRLPDNVYVENIDITMAMDKVAYFTRMQQAGAAATAAAAATTVQCSTSANGN